MTLIVLIAFSIVFAAVLPATPMATPVGTDRSSSTLEAVTVHEIWRLDRAVAGWERRCQAAGRGVNISTGDLERDVRRLVTALAPLEAQAAKSSPEDGGALGRKVATLRARLSSAEVFVRTGDASRCASPVAVTRVHARTIDPVGECRGATPVGEEAVAWRFPAASDDWTAPVTGVAWLRVEPERDGWWEAHTRGSTADTEIAVFVACDGARALAFNDDMLGLQSAVRFEAVAGESRWIRVGQRIGTAFSPVVLTVRGATGGISGVVTESTTGDPISNTQVRIYERDTGWSVASAWSGSDGTYMVQGLESGTYVARTRFSDEHLDELWDDHPCYDDCDVTTGDPIPVLDERVTSGIDFALLRAGAISGRLRDVETGEALADYRVNAQVANGSSGGDAFTDSAGRYTIGGLQPGVHFVWTNGNDHRDEVWDDIPCLPYCEPENGTPILVAAEQTTDGIDFDLHAFGLISGEVTATSGGAPIPFISLRFYDALGFSVGSSSADETGYYTRGGLEAGVYFVATDGYGGYRNEVYDDVPCTGTGSGSCDPLSGVPVPVLLGETTTGIDLALDRLGAFAGKVTDELSGAPLPLAQIDAWAESGQFIGGDWSDVLGLYVVEDLIDGTYFATTESPVGYLDELYDDLPCPEPPGPGCDPTTGSPIDVALEGVTSDIDFALTPGGAVAGTLTDSLTSDPIENRYIDLWNAGGTIAGQDETDETGRYYVDTLSDGTYFATTRTFGDYVDELYDDLPCPGGAPGGCDPTTGTPIAVAIGATTADIDLALLLRGGLSGNVTDGSGAPLPGIGIDVWDDAGSHLESSATDAGGVYQVDLSSGFFFVSTDAGQGYLDEIWDDVPCPDGPAILGLCDPLAGTSVEVIGADPAVTNIDFQLAIPIFADGFESGDTSAWSSTVP